MNKEELNALIQLEAVVANYLFQCGANDNEIYASEGSSLEQRIKFITSMVEDLGY